MLRLAVVGTLVLTAWLGAPTAASAEPEAATSVAALRDAATPSTATHTPPGATPTAATGGADRPRLRVEAQDFAVAPDGDFRMFLDIDDAPGGSDIAVQIYDRIDDPDGLAASTTSEPADILATFDLTPLAAQAVASQPALFAISLYGPGDERPTGVAPGWAYRLDEPGVYPIRIRLRGPDRSDLVTVVTYLVREPESGASNDSTPSPAAPAGSADTASTVDPVEVSLLADITAEPPANGRADAALDSAYREALERFLSTTADHPEVPLDIAATPDVTARLNDDPAAIDTLDALRAQLQRPDTELLGAPYVDIDPASLTSVALGDELIRQRDLGNRTLERALGPFDATNQPVGDTWRIDRPLDRETTTALDDLGITRLVVPPTVVDGGPPKGPFTLATDDRSRPLAAMATVAMPDRRSTPDDPVLGAYQLLGRIAAQGTIDRGGATTIRVDPQSVDTTMLTTLLSTLAEPGSSLHATTVTEAFDTAVPSEPPAALAPPRPTKLGRWPALVARTHQLLSAYASMVPERPDLLEPFERPLARSASPALDLNERIAVVRATRRQLDARLGSISTPPTDRVTLGTRNARFPLPISSDLDGPTDVVITLEARDRLSLPRTTIPVRVEPGGTVVPIAVNARATGDTPLLITVRTPDGHEVLSTSRYTVRSTAVSGVGLVLTIGAAAFLALWWARHWWRTRDHGRHGRPSGGAAPDPGDEVFVADDPAGST